MDQPGIYDGPRESRLDRIRPSRSTGRERIARRGPLEHVRVLPWVRCSPRPPSVLFSHVDL
jgi:hypothetical protein